MPRYILHYFRGNGRAVIARAILAYSKADWINNKIKREDWPKIKKSNLCEFEQLPVLEVDGKKYCESQAINLYLAEVFNLMGKNCEENYQIINLLMGFNDCIEEIWKNRYSSEEKKKYEYPQKAEKKLKFYFRQLEKKYINFGKNEYFLGEKFTLADIVIAVAYPAAVDSLGKNEYLYKDISPNIWKLIKRLKENELNEFYEKYYNKIICKKGKIN